MSEKVDFTGWTEATAALKPGEQRVFLDVLQMAADGKIKLVHGSDYSNGGACLVNQARNFLGAVDRDNLDPVITPAHAFNSLVCQFDNVCSDLAVRLNVSGGVVTPVMADFLIKNFGELKPMIVSVTSDPTQQPVVYREKNDEEFESWLNEMMLNGITEPGPIIHHESNQAPVGE